MNENACVASCNRHAWVLVWDGKKWRQIEPQFENIEQDECKGKPYNGLKICGKSPEKDGSFYLELE